MIVFALVGLVEQSQRGRDGVASATLFVEAGHDGVPQRRGAAFLSGLLEGAAR